MGNGFVFNQLFEIALPLVGVRVAFFKPMGVCVQGQAAGWFSNPAVFSGFLLAILRYFRRERYGRRGYTRARNDEEGRFAVRAVFASLLDFRDCGCEIDFARKTAPSGEGARCGDYTKLFSRQLGR